MFEAKQSMRLNMLMRLLCHSYWGKYYLCNTIVPHMYTCRAPQMQSGDGNKLYRFEQCKFNLRYSSL